MVDRSRTQDMPATLAAFFRLYPQPRLVQDLWTVLEDARVEFWLQKEYPGLRSELAQLAGEVVTPRDPAHGLTVKELIIDCVLRLSTGESEASAVPHAVKEEVSELWTRCQALLTARATAEDAIRVAHDVYVRMEELLAPRVEMIQADHAGEESPEVGVGPTASEETGEAYRPVTNWVYRGAMNPEFFECQPDVGRTASQRGGAKEGRSAGQGPRGDHPDATLGGIPGGGREL